MSRFHKDLFYFLRSIAWPSSQSDTQSMPDCQNDKWKARQASVPLHCRKHSSRDRRAINVPLLTRCKDQDCLSHSLFQVSSWEILRLKKWRKVQELFLLKPQLYSRALGSRKWWSLQKKKNQWGYQYRRASYYGPVPHSIIVKNTQSWLSKVVGWVHYQSCQVFFCLTNFFPPNTYTHHRQDRLYVATCQGVGRTWYHARRKRWHSGWSSFTLYGCFWEGESPIKNAWEMGADVTLNMLPAAEILVHRNLREG